MLLNWAGQDYCPGNEKLTVSLLNYYLFILKLPVNCIIHTCIFLTSYVNILNTLNILIHLTLFSLCDCLSVKST